MCACVYVSVHVCVCVCVYVCVVQQRHMTSLSLNRDSLSLDTNRADKNPYLCETNCAFPQRKDIENEPHRHTSLIETSEISEDVDHIKMLLGRSIVLVCIYLALRGDHYCMACYCPLLLLWLQIDRAQTYKDTHHLGSAISTSLSFSLSFHCKLHTPHCYF